MFDFLRVAASRLRSVLRLRRMDDDFQRELDSHLALMTDENVRRGMPRDQAERAARLRLGGFTQLRETNRELHGLPVIETFAQDLRYAWRVLRKNPVFTLIAVVTLALGIGANTAIFSVVNAVFLRPLPFPHSDRIFVVRRVGNRIGGASLSMPIYLAWQQQAAPVLERLAMVAWRGSATLSGSGDPAPLPSSGASTGLFSLLGVHPALGRDFRPEEGRPGGPHVVILSDRLWRARFAADPNILGRDLTLDGASYTVVGVMPPSFSVPLPGLDDTALWFPIQVPLASDNPSNGGLLCLGLLRAGATPQQAEAALTPPLSALHDRFPSMFTPGERVRLDPLRNFITSRAGTAPLLLFGAVMLVLLLACVNVANLLLAAGTVRAQEMALRAALGATRRRIVRQLLTESVLLSFVGGALGVAACYALFGGVVRLIPAFTPHVGDFRMDGVVLGFAVALSVLTGVLFGLVPALGASSVDLNGVLKTAGSRAASRGHSGLRRALAANEIALALVLLVGAALALQSLARLMNVQPGFDPSNVLTFQLSLPRSQYPTPEQRQAFFDQALSRFSSLPGIERAGAANLLPFVGGNDNLFTIEDGPSRTSDVKLAADIRIVSPDFFATLRIPQARGRMFSSADRPGTLPVAILNREAAREYWPQGEPVGTHVWIGKPMGPANAEPAPRQIVGIVGDIHESSLASPPEPTIYIPLAQVPSADSPFYAAFFLLRTTRDPLASVPDVRSAVRSLDPAMPMERLHTMDDILAASVQDWRFRAVLLGAFGALALLIAAIGVYGVISYSVAQRTREIGVRVALGATRRNVLGLVLRHGMITALVGILIGLAAALALTRLMASLLFGIDARDPLTFLAVAFLLALVALAACYLPARRAMHVEPMTALRYE